MGRSKDLWYEHIGEDYAILHEREARIVGRNGSYQVRKGKLEGKRSSDTEQPVKVRGKPNK